MLLRLINKKRMQECKEGEKRRSPVLHRFQAFRASKHSTGNSLDCKPSSKQMHYTCLLTSYALILEPEAAILLVSDRT